jgi:hypothetical protein
MAAHGPDRDGEAPISHVFDGFLNWLWKAVIREPPHGLEHVWFAILSTLPSKDAITGGGQRVLPAITRRFSEIRSRMRAYWEACALPPCPRYHICAD